MAFNLSERSNINPFRILGVIQDIYRLRAQGRDVISFGAGQPSKGLPQVFIDAAHKSLESNPLQPYTPCVGIEPLRAAVAKDCNEREGLDINPENVAIVPGSSIGLVYVLAMGFEPGDKVMFTRPFYPAHLNLCKLLGIEAVILDANAETGFQPTQEMFEAEYRRRNGDIQGVITCSPANPTGATLSDEENRKISEWCHQEGINQISDEAYKYVEYGEKSLPSAMNYNPDAVVVRTRSKYYRATGFRMGEIICRDPAVIKRFDAVAQNGIISSVNVSQEAALDMYREEHRPLFQGEIDRYRKNRKVMKDALIDSGLLTSQFAEAVGNPGGAFYWYYPIDHLHPEIHSERFARALLQMDDINVAVAPGTDFDDINGHKWVRATYAGEESDIVRGSARIKQHLQQAIDLSLTYEA